MWNGQTKITNWPHESVVRIIESLELIHSDLCEFEGILTRGGNRYIITFINDFSKYKTVYLLKTKSDAFEKFQDFFKRSWKSIRWKNKKNKKR